MRLFASLLLLAALAAPASADQGRALVGRAECPAHLDAISPRLAETGFTVVRANPVLRTGETPVAAGGELLRAIYSEAAGTIQIEYSCGAEGLAVTIENRGLPNIPFHVLLAAGPSAVLKQSLPDGLRERYGAVLQ